MSLALKYAIKENNVIIKKCIVGSISIIFKNRKSIVISDDNEVNLSKMCDSEDLNHSNLKALIDKGFINLVIYR